MIYVYNIKYHLYWKIFGTYLVKISLYVGIIHLNLVL